MSAEENKALVLRRLHSGVLRLRSGWLPILQTAVAACLAWFLAVLLLGLERPTFAPIAAGLATGGAVGEGARPAGARSPPGGSLGARGATLSPGRRRVGIAGGGVCVLWEVVG